MKELVWLPDEPGVYTHEEAMKLEDSTKRLPTIGELRIAWENGVKFENKWYWSSSVYPSKAGFTFDLDGGNGYIYYDYRDSNDGSVRCVRR